MTARPARGPDVAIWGMNNTRSLVTLRRVAEACVAEGLRTVLLWWPYRGSSARTPADYPVAGLEFHEVEARYDFGPLKYPHTLTLPLLRKPLRRALEDLAPRSLVTQLDHAFADRVWHWAAKGLGIPGVVLQEGMANMPKNPLLSGRDRKAWERRWSDPRWHWRCVRVLPHPLLRHASAYTYADYAFVWGEGMKRHLVEAGRSPDSTVVTGSPAMDHIVGRCPLTPMERRTVMYVHQTWQAPAELKLRRYEEVLRASVLGLGCRLLFKLHPGCAYEAPGIRALASRLGCPPHLVEVVEQGDAVQLLGEVSVVIIASSTMGYHAAVAGVPLVVLDYYFDDLRFDIGDTGGAAVVRTPEELPGALARAVDDPVFRDALHRGAGRMLEEHLYALDGGSSVRVARALRGLVEGGAPRRWHCFPAEDQSR